MTKLERAEAAVERLRERNERLMLYRGRVTTFEREELGAAYRRRDVLYAIRNHKSIENARRHYLELQEKVNQS